MSQGTVEHVRAARRILCFGATGSGKSMMALELSRVLGLPLVLVDDLCWGPNWTQASAEVQDEHIIGALLGDSYVIDSVYRRHNAVALDRVDVVVALDYPRLVSLARLIRRTARRIRTRELVCNGNIETLGRALGRDSIVWWHFRSWRSKRERMRAWHADEKLPPVVLLRRPRDAEALLAAMRPFVNDAPD
ncbi:MAG: adenylate kinase [Cryobacterium sp.]|nr:adenylate kinase [Cryobacterium sp.]